MSSIDNEEANERTSLLKGTVNVTDVPPLLEPTTATLQDEEASDIQSLTSPALQNNSNNNEAAVSSKLAVAILTIGERRLRSHHFTYAH
jgi:hypothetical protein